MRPLKSDPAPSRLAYKMQRLALTPSVRRSFTIGMPLATLALIAGLAFADGDRRERLALAWTDLKSQIRQREEFQVRVMEIRGASERTQRAIREVSHLEFPLSSFDLDLARLRETVEGLDAVERADLRVRSGGVLDVAIEERRPALVWRHAAGHALIDAGGHRTALAARRSDHPNLPLVTGAGADRMADEALRLVSASAPVADRLIGLVRVGERRWNVALTDGVTILLPATGALAAYEAALGLADRHALLGRDVTDIDMRLPDRPTVRIAPEAAGELRRRTLLDLGAQ